MKIHVLYHVPFEGLGSIKDWIIRKGHVIAASQLYNNQTLPEPDGFDMLIIMGGPMSTNEEETYSWLGEEKELIRETAHRHKAILGICLGAQLIAHALGGKVYSNSCKEIGWFPVFFNGNSLDPDLAAILPHELTVFHWHGDTFDLPRDAVLIASSGATRNQGFIIDRNIVGLQFHLEMKRSNIESLYRACSGDIVKAPFVQDIAHILNNESHTRQSNALMDALLDYFERIIQQH